MIAAFPVTARAFVRWLLPALALAACTPSAPPPPVTLSSATCPIPLKLGTEVAGTVRVSYMDQHGARIINSKCTQYYALHVSGDNRAILDGYFYRYFSMDRRLIGYEGMFDVRGKVEYRSDSGAYVIAVTAINLQDEKSLKLF